MKFYRFKFRKKLQIIDRIITLQTKVDTKPLFGKENPNTYRKLKSENIQNNLG